MWCNKKRKEEEEKEARKRQAIEDGRVAEALQLEMEHNPVLEILQVMERNDYELALRMSGVCGSVEIVKFSKNSKKFQK